MNFYIKKFCTEYNESDSSQKNYSSAKFLKQVCLASILSLYFSPYAKTFGSNAETAPKQEVTKSNSSNETKSKSEAPISSEIGFKNNEDPRILDQNKVNKLNDIFDELEQRLESMSKRFAERYSDMVSSFAPEEPVTTEYAVLDKPRIDEESEVQTSLRKIKIDGKNFLDNFLIIKINAPEHIEIDKHFVLIGYDKDVSVRSPLNIGRSNVCLTTIDLQKEIQFNDTRNVSERTMQDFFLANKEPNGRPMRDILNSTCKQIPQDKLEFIRKKEGMVKDIQKMKSTDGFQDLDTNIGTLTLPDAK